MLEVLLGSLITLVSFGLGFVLALSLTQPDKATKVTKIFTKMVPTLSSPEVGVIRHPTVEEKEELEKNKRLQDTYAAMEKDLAKVIKR